MMDLSGDELLAQQAAAWQTLSLSPVWRPIDRELAQFLLRLNRRLGGADEPALALCIALLSHELGEGDVCLALARSAPGAARRRATAPAARSRRPAASPGRLR